jgi:hypothetical protein
MSERKFLEQYHFVPPPPNGIAGKLPLLIPEIPPSSSVISIKYCTLFKYLLSIHILWEGWWGEKAMQEHMVGKGTAVSRGECWGQQRKTKLECSQGHARFSIS